MRTQCGVRSSCVNHAKAQNIRLHQDMETWEQNEKIELNHSILEKS
ncbi:conserved hypothetical protein ['Nostoc azollae' 0708]|jgi:hypothetical protein|uniref:Uncharacterized protein n=1 Tax=Nostoc azollae (strain 0708) TaxID=551115 RepID=D7E4A3_NOSA0|nr:conserved hypothetical protein ['Nostoc azollae' 0708]